jgi:hypothetical protein
MALDWAMNAGCEANGTISAKHAGINGCCHYYSRALATPFKAITNTIPNPRGIYYG